MKYEGLTRGRCGRAYSGLTATTESMHVSESSLSIESRKGASVCPMNQIGTIR